METPKPNAFRRMMENLRFKYRLVVMNDETYEERYSLKLSQLNLFTAVGLLSIFLILITTVIIAFTPLREYIPGYSSDVNMRRQVLALATKVDSLEQNAAAKEALLQNIRNVISGKVEAKPAEARTGTKTPVSPGALSPSPQESEFRQEIDKEDRYDINAQLANSRLSQISNYYFFTPMKGKITTLFNPGERHFGIDIVAPRNEAVKATLDGTVVFAGWTSEFGHVIHIQHANNLVSVYEHNAVLLKKEGEVVKAGEAIAITGNSGELSTAPHLHFELWFDGDPVDPRDLMVF